MKPDVARRKLISIMRRGDLERAAQACGLAKPWLEPTTELKAAILANWPVDFISQFVSEIVAAAKRDLPK